MCVCVGGHVGFDVCGGSYACGGVESRSVFMRVWQLGGRVSDYSGVLIEDQRAFPFFFLGLGDVRYSGCTKDYSSALEPPGGLGGV